MIADIEEAIKILAQVEVDVANAINEAHTLRRAYREAREEIDQMVQRILELEEEVARHRLRETRG